MYDLLKELANLRDVIEHDFGAETDVLDEAMETLNLQYIIVNGLMEEFGRTEEVRGIAAELLDNDFEPKDIVRAGISQEIVDSLLS